MRMVFLFSLSLIALGATARSPRTQNQDPNAFYKLWAYEAVNADLMNEEIRAYFVGLGKSIPKQKIAVIDSGLPRTALFDIELRIPRGHVQVPNPPRDHALSVSAVIAGDPSYRIAVKPQLRIYDNSTDEDEKAASVSATRQGLIEACQSDFKVINISMGTLVPYHEPERFNGFISSLSADLSRNGCILVNSSGNLEVINPSFLRLQKPNDFFVLVGAARRTGGRASFSNLAEIYAPGENIFTLKDRSTSAMDLKLDSGTSYAAPFVAAIIANLRTVLETKSEFNSLTGPARSPY